MKSCREVMAVLDRIIDGEAGALEKVSFSLHLAMCGPCETYFRQYRAVRESLGELGRGDLPEDFSEVMGRMLAHVFDGNAEEPSAREREPSAEERKPSGGE